jgi:hypothetical protein
VNALATIQPLPSMSQWPPGIHANVPAELYHRRELGVVNKGALDQLAHTPAHYRAWVDGAEQEETPALAFGRALHCAVLEPEVFDRDYIIAREHPYIRVSDRLRNAKKPSQGTLDAIAYWDAWEAEMGGKIEISAEDAVALRGMQASVLEHPIAGKLFDGGMPEATAVWTDPRTGLTCKARFDVWRDDLVLIGDLKSTEDASPAAFARSVARYRYHVQDAHYSAGAAALGFPGVRFVFVGVEKTPPYAVGVYMLDVESASRGAELRDRDMDRLNECLRTDAWPGYAPVVHTLALPNWAFSD